MERVEVAGAKAFRLKTWPQFNTHLLENERFGFYLNSNAGGKWFADSTGMAREEG